MDKSKSKYHTDAELTILLHAVHEYQSDKNITMEEVSVRHNIDLTTLRNFRATFRLNIKKHENYKNLNEDRIKQGKSISEYSKEYNLSRSRLARVSHHLTLIERIKKITSISMNKTEDTSKELKFISISSTDSIPKTESPPPKEPSKIQMTLESGIMIIIPSYVDKDEVMKIINLLREM
jgi:hypothetical protein